MTKIDTSIKAIVVKLRNENKSFQEIRDILEQEYGIVRSRQAVCILYNKIIEGMCKEARDSDLCISILMCKTLGYTIQETIDTVSKHEGSCSKYKVNSVIKDNADVLAEFEKESLNTIIRGISNTRCLNDNDVQRLKDSLSYKYLRVKDDKFAEYVAKATEYWIEQYATGVIHELYTILGDVSWVNKVRTMQLNIPLKKIKEHE